MTRNEIVKKLDTFVAAFHNYDLETVVAMFAENGSAQQWTGQQVIGRKAIREEGSKEFFNKQNGEISWTIERVDVDESANVAWSIWTMHHTKDGKTTNMRGCDTFEFDKDGLIVRNAAYVISDQPKSF
jgi:ketosteroid isomerase-like protein